MKEAAHTGNIVLDWYETKKNVDEMKRGREGRLKKWERTVASYFPRGARVLDIGCGMGREAFALADAGFSVTGVDISSEVIAQVNILSNEQGRTIPFLLYDGHHLPFENASFDAVIIWAQTFGLLYGDEYKASFLKECARVLTGGGLLSFSGHDAEYLEEHYRTFVQGRKFYPYADTALYWETFFADDLSSRAQNAGLTVILCERGEVYAPEDGTILHCLCRKTD